MEPELPQVKEPPEPATSLTPDPGRGAASEWREASRRVGFDWLLIGPHGLRAGWSILIFVAAFNFFRMFVGTILFSSGLVDEARISIAALVLAGEAAALVAVLGAAALMGVLEGHHISAYNLAARHLLRHLLSGLISGFAALSLLVGALAWGGWLHFNAAALSGSQIFRFAALWAGAFLLVGAVEEGLFRCYGLSTLARGINFWWALAAQVAICIYPSFDGGGNGAYGVYAAAALGLVPCLVLHFRKSDGSSFWQGAWVTSTAFALYHTQNGGENWVGILAAASIGFVFCVSVWVTGSAWWAIGCHAAWDWSETFFFGTPDSGIVAQGHYLSTAPAGNALLSGGADGPEGSLLVLAAILLLLAALFVAHGRRKSGLTDAAAAPTTD